ncbi:MAG: rod shape-determining protein, partial [Clostridia bacterium]|nr:rod shape-determining protein [Clostridia bacterium]
IRVAGDDIDKDIIEYIKNKRNVLLGGTAAEEIKNTIGAAYSSMTEEKMQVKGRELTTGLPETITVSTSEIQVAMQKVIEEILRAINETLERTPPEIAADVMGNGIVISGGGAYIKNIDRYINSIVNIPVHLADNPLDCVIKGTGIALNNIEILKKAAQKRRK